MSNEIRLGEFSTTPLYNIKAVVQATDISSSTLRAWERRYNVCRPRRSHSGYRLYSDQDVAVIRWLKTQVDAGMSISQAVSWLDRLVDDANGLDNAKLPGSFSEPVEPRVKTMAAPATAQALGNFDTLQEELLGSLLRFDEPVAEQVFSQAFSLYTIEQVGDHLVMPVLVELGERWHRGELSITSEHFATNYLLQRLAALLRALPNIVDGPLVWIGCAPGELHEVAPVLLSIYMRRAGFRVHYFGQNLPVEDFVDAVRHHQPAMVMLSASTMEAVQGLRQLADLLTQIEPPRPIVGYGGRIFNREPALRTDISGLFLGASARDAVEIAADLLQEAASQRRMNAHG